MVLVKHGIVVSRDELSRRATRGYEIPFTVVEEKVDAVSREVKRERRFILWPREHNSWVYGHGYMASLPELQHSSYFIRHVLCEAATIRDLRLSFFYGNSTPSDPCSGSALMETSTKPFELSWDTRECRKKCKGHLQS